MPVGADHLRPKGRRKPGEEVEQKEKAQREGVQVPRDRSLSQDAAARLQQAMGNLATRALLERPGASGMDSDDHAAREKEREEADASEPDTTRERRPAPPILPRGLPAVSSGGTDQDHQYGGDDDDDPPLPLPDERHPLALPSAGRGNRARLEALRASGRIAPEAMEDPPPQRGAAGMPRSPVDPGIPSGDARFRSPLAAWGVAAHLAGRAVGPEDLMDLAGPLDPLARPSLAAEFLALYAQDPLARTLARLAALPTGALVAGTGSAAGRSALLAALVVLSLACGPPHQAAVRDRAVHLALDEDALEKVLTEFGERTRTVPAAHVLVRPHLEAEGEPGPMPQLGEAARHWLVPALARAGRVVSLPEPPCWDALPEEEPGDPSDPAACVDHLLNGEAPGVLTAEAVAPYTEAVAALLVTGGRLQVEVAAAALAGRTPGRGAEALRVCRVLYRHCRETTAGLLAARKDLVEAVGRPLPEALPEAARAAGILGQSHDILVAARQEALEGLAALADPGASTGDGVDACTSIETQTMERAEALEAGALPGHARSLLATAVQEAEAGGNRRLAGRLGLALGALLIRQGAVEEAQGRLLECIEAAIVAEDALVATAAGLLALALTRGRAAWDEAGDLADRVGRLAVLRRNPAAILAAADGRSVAALATGDPQAALSTLLACDQLLLTLGETPACALVSARLAEVRIQMGDEAFEDIVRRG